MNILNQKALLEFIKKHPDAKASIGKWILSTSSRKWENPSEVKDTFNTVDYIGDDLYKFKIKWNDYRLIVYINFKTQIVVVRFIGTHAEYDRVNVDALKYIESKSG